MEPPKADEVGLVTKVLAICAGVISTVFGAFKMLSRRIADVEKSKAEQAQVYRHHSAILDLYHKGEKFGERLNEMERSSHARHVELLNAIHSVHGGSPK